MQQQTIMPSFQSLVVKAGIAHIRSDCHCLVFCLFFSRSIDPSLQQHGVLINQCLINLAIYKIMSKVKFWYGLQILALRYKTDYEQIVMTTNPDRKMFL